MATTAKKGKGKIIALFLALIIIAGAVVAFVLLNNKKATAVMECNVNPNIQFVLDQNNRVMRVNYLNEDAEAIFKEVNFNGKSADEAAQLFVELSTKSGFIDVKTTGTRVDITLSCETPDNYKDLEQKITNKVDEYFDENGIIAGAVTKVSNNISEAVQKIGLKATELKNKSLEEIFELYEEQSKDLEGIAVSLHSALFEFIDDLKSTTFSMLDSMEETIAELEAQLNNSQIPAELKSMAQKELDSVKKLYNENKDNFKKMVNDKIETLKQMSKEIFEKAKSQIKQAQETAKQVIEQHKALYEQNKAEIDQKIANYRASLVFAN